MAKLKSAKTGFDDDDLLCFFADYFDHLSFFFDPHARFYTYALSSFRHFGSDVMICSAHRHDTSLVHDQLILASELRAAVRRDTAMLLHSMSIYLSSLTFSHTLSMSIHLSSLTLSQPLDTGL